MDPPDGPTDSGEEMATILDKIIVTKRDEIAKAKSAFPAEELRARLPDAPDVRDFFAALSSGPPIRLIAEVKKASPSKGVIREDFDPVAIALDYEAAGASCISCLTDRTYFQGHLSYLAEIRQHVSIPILRKDFVIDSYQLLEARVAGADAVLLIAECLDDCHLRKLHHETLDLGMVPLVEFHGSDQLSRVVEAGASLIGVNNRDLHTFDVDLQHTVRMRSALPEECLVVGESGIHGVNDAKILESAGVDAMLVGEHLMSQRDIQAAVRELLQR